MLPDRCSVQEDSRRCPNPPEFVISIVDDTGEYMIGVTCARHRGMVSAKAATLQQRGRLRQGRVRFEPLKSVGTDCIKGDAEDLIGIRSNDSKSKPGGT